MKLSNLPYHIKLFDNLAPLIKEVLSLKNGEYIEEHPDKMIFEKEGEFYEIKIRKIKR